MKKKDMERRIVELEAENARLRRQIEDMLRPKDWPTTTPEKSDEPIVWVSPYNPFVTVRFPDRPEWANLRHE